MFVNLSAKRNLKPLCPRWEHWAKKYNEIMTMHKLYFLEIQIACLKDTIYGLMKKLLTYLHLA